MVVDYERAWVKLKTQIAAKPSHSARELFEGMSRIEVACEIPEEQEGFDDRPRRPVNVLEARNGGDTSTSNETPAGAVA